MALPDEEDAKPIPGPALDAVDGGGDGGTVDAPASAEPDRGAMTDDVRRANLAEVAGFLVTAGYSMRLVAERQGDEAAQAVAACIQMCGSLAQGVKDLLEDRNFYAAASCGRQILETTSLITYLSTNPERAKFWLVATDKEMRKASDFQPASLRRATATSGLPYGHHCAVGGHPRSIGRNLLPGGGWYTSKAVLQVPGIEANVSLYSLLLADTLQHLYTAVLAILRLEDWRIFAGMGDLESRIAMLTDQLVTKLVEWRASDLLATLTVG